ncbi:MAG: transcriptional repressor [Deltaproteobacteria bacterium]|nr:transcriptional repressor [Deltaproteobacteria bacterium]MBF0527632.1 transcriptional repressor [Deltaproteobacteria bacterium]
MTHQRKVILENLRKLMSHPTADELFLMVRKQIPKISLGTVYRNLEQLSEKGLIQKLELSGSQKRFDGNVTRHYHALCLKCDRVADIQIKPPPGIEEATSGFTDYVITGHRLEYVGWCPNCAELKNPNPLNANDGETTMPGKPNQTTELDYDHKRILLMLVGQDKPSRPKDIAALTGLDSKTVTDKIKTLKTLGYVDSPVRCTYAVTEAGKMGLTG